MITAVAMLLETHGRSGGHWTEVVRPMAVVVVASVVLTALAYVAVRRRPALASAIGIFIVVLVLRPAAWYLVALLVGGGQLVSWLSLRRRATGNTMATWMLYSSAALAVISVSALITSGALTLKDFAVHEPHREAGVHGDPERPSIYVLVLDGYPRSDELAASFEIDNSEFTASLARMGFRHHPAAQSQFDGTKLTLASTMLADATPLMPLSVIDSADDLLHSWRTLRREYLVNTPIMDQFREAGYHLSYLPADGGGVEWQGWDETISSAHVSDFEVSVLQTSLLASTLDVWLLDQLRDRSARLVDEWSSVDSTSGPDLVLGHLMPPHPPFLWNADGPANSFMPCWYSVQCSHQTVIAAHQWLTLEEYGIRLRPQIDAVNAMVLPAVKRIIDRDPTAAIILMSDHGGRFVEGAAEAHHTFLAARVPHQPDLLDARPGPDGLFVRLFETLPR